MRQKRMQNQSTGQATREERAAAALRENLLKRKDQLRARAQKNDEGKDCEQCP